MNATVIVLTNTRTVLTDPARWTQGEFARKASGIGTTSMNPEAVCFCLLGAVSRAAYGTQFVTKEEDYDTFREGATNARNELFNTLNIEHEFYEFAGRDIPGFNDNPDTKHEHVLALIDKTIARLSKE